MGRASAARNADYRSLRPKAASRPAQNRLVETTAGDFSLHPKDPIGEEEPKLTGPLVWRWRKSLSTLSTFRVLTNDGHASSIWTCDFSAFKPFRSKRFMSSSWFGSLTDCGLATQEAVECCARDREPPRFTIVIARYGASLERRVRHSGYITCCNLWRPHRSLGQNAYLSNSDVRYLTVVQFDRGAAAHSFTARAGSTFGQERRVFQSVSLTW